MTIAETQEKMIRDILIEQQLKKGVIPNVALISELENNAFRTRMAGLPRFIQRDIRKGITSSKSDYNQMFEEMLMDLNVSFEEVKRINNKIMSLSHYFESNRTRINSITQQIELRVNSFDSIIDNSSSAEVFGEQFSNFLNINFKENKQRNIPKTTAFIDLVNGCVEMKRQKKATKQQVIGDANVTFIADSTYKTVNISSANNLLNDIVDTYWQTIVVSTVEGGVQGELNVNLKESVTATSVQLDLQIGKPAYTTMLVSVDGKEFVSLEEAKITSSYKWEMEARKIKHIKFIMRKLDKDRVNGSEFEYVFGGRNIKIVEDLYEDSSCFVSKPYEIKNHEAIQRIRLEADDLVLPNTEIKYYIGFDYGNNLIEWEEIKNKDTIVTNMVKEKTLDITPNTLGYGELNEVQYGAEFYRIGQLQHTPIKKSLKVLKGKNVWVKEVIPAPFIYEKTDDESDSIIYPTGAHDWVKAKSGKKSYISIQNGFDYLRKDYFHRYSCYVHTEDVLSYEATFLGTSQTSQSVYINNERVALINGKYKLSFHEGWNKIEVYVYAREINEEIILDFFLPDLKHEVFCEQKPLEEVSLYELKNNTSIRDHNKIAIDESNNLIVNYNPYSYQVVERNEISEIASSINGLEYVLRYNYSTNKKDLHSIRVMAILQKKATEIQATPKILGYKLIIE